MVVLVKPCGIKDLKKSIHQCLLKARSNGGKNHHEK